MPTSLRFRRRSASAGILLAMSLMASSVHAAGTAPCPALTDPDLHCVASAQGWFHAREPDAAARIAEDAAIAAQAFQRYFGRPAPRGAVVAGGTGRPLSGEDHARLAAAGADWQLPWLDAADRKTLQRNMVERALREQLPDASDADIDAKLEAALPAGASTNDTDAADRSALRHEMGHMFLIHAFWPAPAADDSVTGSHYGGTGPDWLDELAAVLMESDTMAAGRRERLHAPDADEHLVPLDRFFRREHPMSAQVSDAVADGESSSVLVISGEEARRLAGDAHWFYAQARGLADFLLSKGDPAIFGRIAAHLSKGGDMDGWLAGQGAQAGLPDSVAGLDAAWRQWLASGGDQRGDHPAAP